eukprot:8553611-Pyramimonas_sp.AAC.1
MDQDVRNPRNPSLFATRWLWQRFQVLVGMLSQGAPLEAATQPLLQPSASISSALGEHGLLLSDVQSFAAEAESSPSTVDME